MPIPLLNPNNYRPRPVKDRAQYKEVVAKLLATKIVKVPVCLRCFCCEEDYEFKRRFEMFICSPKFLAEYYDTVIWKCPRCKRSKAERTDKGDGGRFYFMATKMGLVGNFC